MGDVLVPDLPEWARKDVWTLRWWEYVWAQPIASHWSPTDVPALARLALLEGQVASGLLDDDKVLREMRMLEDRFGLNPKARQQLGWREEKPKPAPGELPARASSLSERRKRLIADAS
jgi:hypothetical protein